ncbi:hypothetical protein CCMA1212_002550 [Trichoderma ghanense]|uniref:Uncharacterized protein n=1 Tax=Trichoderma ghanense TaxID=65468 RepID=A0ABY2HBM5_9HYPO
MAPAAATSQANVDIRKCLVHCSVKDLFFLPYPAVWPRKSLQGTETPRHSQLSGVLLPLSSREARASVGQGLDNRERGLLKTYSAYSMCENRELISEHEKLPGLPKAFFSFSRALPSLLLAASLGPRRLGEIGQEIEGCNEIAEHPHP